MTTLIENDSKEIAKILQSTGRSVLDILVDKDALEVMLEIISNELKKRWEVDNTIPLETLPDDKQRKILISRARSVASVAIRLDDIGKDEVSKLKELPKKVDAGRKLAREYFENWKLEIRKPVTEWEAEQEKVKALAQKLLDEESAWSMNSEIDAVREIAKQAAIRQQEELKAGMRAQVIEELKITETAMREIPTEKENLGTNHKTFVHRQVLAFCMEHTIKMSEADAKALITAIAKGKSPYIKINY